MNFKKNKKKQQNGHSPIPIGNGALVNGESLSNQLGVSMQRFNPEIDLKAITHDGVMHDLKIIVDQTAKDGRFSPRPQKRCEIQNLCEGARIKIKNDIDAFKLLVAQGNEFYKSTLTEFDKNAVASKFQRIHFQQNNASKLSKMKRRLVKLEDRDNARLEQINVKLKYLEYELSDRLSEHYKGQRPRRNWYNR